MSHLVSRCAPRTASSTLTGLRSAGSVLRRNGVRPTTCPQVLESEKNVAKLQKDVDYVNSLIDKGKKKAEKAQKD